MNYSVTKLLKWVAEGLEKSNSVNYPCLNDIISDVYEMYNALCSYGFQEPIEVVKTVAELKKQAQNRIKRRNNLWIRFLIGQVRL